jgi:hypothetical protein
MSDHRQEVSDLKDKVSRLETVNEEQRQTISTLKREMRSNEKNKRQRLST